MNNMKKCSKKVSIRNLFLYHSFRNENGGLGYPDSRNDSYLYPFGGISGGGGQMRRYAPKFYSKLVSKSGDNPYSFLFVIVSKKSVLLLKTSTVLHDYDTLEESLDSFLPK